MPQSNPIITYDPTDLLAPARAALDSALGEDSTPHFSDDTLLFYLAEHCMEEGTVYDPSIDADRPRNGDDAVEQLVLHAVDRFQRRPGSGHEKAQATAAKDDPVGRATDQNRRAQLAAYREQARDRMRDELEAATGVRPRRP